ncbi:hypothetical protein RB597_001384 [Gaeumannomyces tritici]
MSASLLAAHLEQIAISCQGIDSLPFPPPRIFTNALLSTHDITSLIRDTEAHERALFSVPPPPPQPQQPQKPANPEPADADDLAGNTGKKRRQTVFNVAAGEVTTGPPPGTGGRSAGGSRRNTAVAAVLGGDLHSQITRAGRGGPRGADGEVDIEVLLRGAEKLCQVYPLPGALDRIPELRRRHAHQNNTLAYYEARVAEQAERLARMNRDHYADDYDDDKAGEEEEKEEDGAAAGGDDGMTEDDLRREEEEVRELDRKKRELQARLRTMDKDLGGLLHM